MGAFTVPELIAVLMALAIIVSVGLMIRSTNHYDANVWAEARNDGCQNNLYQIATAYRVWANDHHDRFPAEESIANGGWREILTNADQGPLCWTNYAIMADVFRHKSNELARFPKILVCPSDERKPAETLIRANREESDFRNNLNLSYFVGVSADGNHPWSLLSGDRNLGPGSVPATDYGYSPSSGVGNDVAIATNMRASPVCWSQKMHHWAGRSNTWGNIILGDGSLLQAHTPPISQDWLSRAFPAATTNWPAGHVPSSPSVRVLFP